MKKSIYIVTLVTAVLLLSFYFSNSNKNERVIINKSDKNIIYQNSTMLYKNNPFNGITEDFLPDGKIKSRTEYGDGMKEGKEIMFFPDGQIYSECCYKKNIIDGKYNGYYSDGTVKFSYNYADGKLDGECTDYFELGQKGIVKNYTGGTEDGPQKEWRRSGRLIMNYNMKDGRKYGLNNESLPCEPVNKNQQWQ